MFFISYATLLDLVIFMELFFRWIKIGLAKIIMGVQEHSGGSTPSPIRAPVPLGITGSPKG